MAKMGTLEVTASTTIDGQEYSRTRTVPYPLFENDKTEEIEKIRGIVEHFGARDVALGFLASFKINEQNDVREEIKAEVKGSNGSKRQGAPKGLGY